MQRSKRKRGSNILSGQLSVCRWESSGRLVYSAGAPAIQLPRGGSSPCSPAVSDLPPVFTKANCPFPPSKASVGFLKLGSISTKSLGCHQGIETLLWPGLAGEKGGSLQRHSNSGPLCYPRQLKGAVLPKTCRASQFRMGTLLVRSGSQGHVAYFQLPSRKHPVFHIDPAALSSGLYGESGSQFAKQQSWGPLFDDTGLQVHHQDAQTLFSSGFLQQPSAHMCTT